MLQRLGIRGKLLAVVAVPTIVLLLAASFVVFNAASAYTNGRNTTELVDVVETGIPAIAALQSERSEVSAYLRAILDGEADRLTARTNVDTSLTVLKTAGRQDPAFAPVADQIAAAVAGRDGVESLDAMRAMSAVDAGTTDFPTWPDETQTQSLSDTFQSIAAAVAAAAVEAPVSDAGNIARSLPELIRTEGTASKAYLDDARKSAEALPDLFVTTDRVGTTVVNGANGISANSTNQPVLGFLGRAETGLQGLPDLRGRVRSGTVSAGPAEASYTAVIKDLLGATREVANVAGDRSLSNSLKGYVSMGELVEAMRFEEDYVVLKIAQGYWRIGEPVQYQQYYFGTNAALVNAQAAVALVPGVTPVPRFGASYSAVDVNGYTTIRDRIINDSTNSALLDQRGGNDWPLQVNEEIAAYDPIIAELTRAVNNRTAADERNSLIQTLATALVAALAVAASLFIALAISRRIVNPLRRLTTTATAVRQELPRLVERVAMPGQTVDVSEVQIPVESQDEVGRLAEAFNSVNAATLAIAAEQAALRGSISEMFVNVARRDQVLLNRQLASIDEMERTEDNQDTLTKLFALDHLATRMRRNSESLLVLAGIDTGRRLRRPMPLSDVIRTASSEIELYERIQLELDADPAMLGHSALTAAHLFAELLENATVFSDPGTQVVVRTMERDGAFVVTVVDRGIGMTPDELGEANSRVASTAASEILGAQRLGLFVVGRIARRVGARVHLESSEGRGTQATVVMPPSLFDPSVSYAQGHSTPTTADDRLHSPVALVHHDPAVEEVSEPVAAARGLSTYQPTVMEPGASLSGRPADAPDPRPKSAPLPPRGVPGPDGPYGIDQLVAADAAQAPALVEFDLEEFTEGVTEVGLPTRRRRGQAGSEAANDTNSIIALPQRASDEQLSALQRATTSGFTPILAADEVSPESAEARSRVFRGFRPLRGTETEPEALAPDAESLGHAMRRGVPIADDEDDDFDSTAAPSIAPDEPARPVLAETGSLPTVGAPASADAFEPEDGARDRGSEVMRNFAADEADRRDPLHLVVRQSPLITTGYVDDSAPTAPDVQIANERASEMLVPQLEDDDEPVAADPVHKARPAVDDRWRGASEGAGVEAVSLDDAPAQPSPAVNPVYRSPLYPVAANPWQQQVPQDAQAHVAQAAPAAPAAANPWQQQAPREAQFEADPVTSVPSLDDLIMDGAGSDHGEDRGGFFSRLFGKPVKGEPAEGKTVPFSAPQGALPERLTTGPAPSWAMPAPEPEPRFETQAPQSYGAPASYEPAPHERWVAAAEPQVHETYRDNYPVRAPEQAPAADLSGYAPANEETPVSDEDLTPQWTMLPPMPQPGPLPYAEAPGFGATPSQPGQGDSHYGEPSRYDIPFGQAPQQGGQGMFGHEEHGIVYSPDQLARPLGWETAGASALQAAAPESATEYRPVVQISPDSSSFGQDDYASAVFSELSSLAAQRPRVETTRAGLAKRTPVAREEVPEAPVHAAASEPRDAEAVRSRFAAFYSGTQRARDDVHNFNESTQGSLTEP